MPPESTWCVPTTCWVLPLLRFMSKLIHRPETSPLAIGVFNLLFLGGGGYLMIGQRRKAILAMVSTMISACVCVGLVIPLVTAVDAYRLACKLQAGESIGEQECSVSVLKQLLNSSGGE